MKESNFYKDNKFGKQAENSVRNYFESKGYQVQDVSEVPAFWDIDVDFIIRKPEND